MAHTCPSAHRPRGGFTLIELLVVIGIIALLLALLLPVLSQARDAAQSTACLSNNRQLLIAANSYASEFRNRIPAVNDRLYQRADGSFAAGGSDREKVDWIGYLGSYYGDMPEYDGLSINRREALVGLDSWNERNAVLYCPKDEFPPDGFSFYPANYRSSSYGVPRAVVWSLDIKGNLVFQDAQSLNLNRAKQASEMALLVEVNHRRRHWLMWSAEAQYLPASLGSLYWHGDYRGAYGFFDGHAEMLHIPPHALGSVNGLPVQLRSGQVVAETSEFAFRRQFDLD